MRHIVSDMRQGVARTLVSLTQAAFRHLRAMRWHHYVFLCLFLGAALQHLYDLGHLYIAPWDEAVHAVVSEHLALHPLQPTLYEIAALPPPYPTDWTSFHIWLHIPPFGMWASALSMRLLGDTPFALRLPGVFFVLGGMLVTYLLGRRLFHPIVGLVGAAFAGFAPYPLLISQGYVFGDNTETPLMLLTPLAILALVWGYRSGRYRWLALAGIFQGLCYLTKGALGLAPTGVALALIAGEWLFRREPGWHRLGLRGIVAFFAPVLLIIGAYNLYIMRAFPASAKLESSLWRQNFFTSVEFWGRPPDYHFTRYLYMLYGPALALLLVGSLLVVTYVAIRRQSRADLILAAWNLALYIPLTAAVTKTPPYTYAAVPAWGLVVARALMLGWSSRSALARAAGLGALLGAALTALLNGTSLLARYTASYRVIIVDSTQDYSLRSRVVPYLLTGAISLAATLLCYLGILAIRRWRASGSAARPLPAVLAKISGSPKDDPRAGLERRAAAFLMLASLLILSAYWLNFDFQAVSVRHTSAMPQTLGVYLASHTPANATILMDSDAPLVRNTRLMIMFWAHRDVYSLDVYPNPSVCAAEQMAAAKNSPFYVLADHPVPGKTVGGIASWTLLTPTCP
jgi:4-amino-4-deoxy-L-arabinose transferase-like glycosyltransferase